jgi:pre-mRNA-splicing factor 38A
MANVTDPLIAQISGSDPQNLMEYITRQKIYDSRYWKEECFGLTVTNVLEKAAALQCLGTFPHTACLALLLKLLQLHPEHALIHSAFIAAPSTFKYARALGSLYIRLTSRPVEIYTALEPLYADFRKLRVYNSAGWSIVTMDEWIHSLLHVPSFTKTSTVLGLTLPRLATRRNLQDNGYLQLTTGLLLRPSDAVLSITLPSSTTALSSNTSTSDNSDDHRDAPPEIRRVLELLRYQAHVKQCPAAMVAWKKRFANSKPDMNHSATTTTTAAATTLESQDAPNPQPKRKKSKREARNYTNLFKSSKPTDVTSTTTAATDHNAASDATDTAVADTNSEAYWNAQRAQLALDKLR